MDGVGGSVVVLVGDLLFGLDVEVCLWLDVYGVFVVDVIVINIGLGVYVLVVVCLLILLFYKVIEVFDIIG